MLSSHLLPKKNSDLFLQSGMKGKYRAEGLFGVRDLKDIVKLALFLQNKITIGQGQIILWFQRKVWAPMGPRKVSGFGSVPQLMSVFILHGLLYLHTLPSEWCQNSGNIRDPQQGSIFLFI